MPFDKVKPLKIESGTDTDFGPTEVDWTEDVLVAKGVAFDNSDDKQIYGDNDDIKFKDLNTNYVNTLEEVAFGGGHFFTGPSEYVRVPVGHNHFVYQEVEVQGEYEILGELVCQE